MSLFQICCEQRATCFSSIYCNWYQVFTHHIKKCSKLFPSTCIHYSHIRITLLITHQILLAKLISLYFECFLSDCLQCKTCWYTNYSITCPTSKYHYGSDLVNKEATTPCLLFCHQKHIISLKIIPSQHKHCQDVTYQCEFLVSEIKQYKNIHAFFFTCGVLKHNFYSNMPSIEDHLKESIQNNKLCYYGTFPIK